MARQFVVLTVVIVAAFAEMSASQTLATPATHHAPKSGPTANVEFGATYDSDGQVYELNPSTGYEFNPHFGLGVGVPFYFINPSSSSGGSSTSGPGDPYLSLHLKYPGSALNFASALTGAAPIGDSKKGLSTGRATFDWTNHFDRAFSNLTPSIDIGIANTIPDSLLFRRPYTTLGLNTNLQGGASYDLGRSLSLAAMGYDILPSGQQTIFSRVTPGQGKGGTVQHGRVYENNQQTKGGASIAHDDGFSAAVDASPTKVVDLELAFTRSLVYDLNAVSFSIDFNLGQLYRRNRD